MPNVKSIAQGQFFEVIGKLIGLRNPRAFQKDRNDADAALQRGLNLDAHEVSGVVQASIAVPVTRIEPAWTNNRKEHVTLGDFLVDRFDEVGANLERGEARQAFPNGVGSEGAALRFSAIGLADQVSLIDLGPVFSLRRKRC